MNGMNGGWCLMEKNIKAISKTTTLGPNIIRLVKLVARMNAGYQCGLNKPDQGFMCYLSDDQIQEIYNKIEGGFYGVSA